MTPGGQAATPGEQAASGRLRGKVAVVAGLGSRVGLRVAELFAAEGASLLLVARTPAILTATAERLRATGAPAVEELCVDVGTPDGARGAVKAADDAFGGLDILYNNIDGFFNPREGIEALRADYWDAAIGALLRPMALCCHESIPLMRRRGGGSIINVTASFPTRQAGNPAFAAGKAGVIGLTLSLARSLQTDGIRVNALAPGRIGLPSVTDGEASGLARTGTGIDVARAALFLGCEESSWITGQVLGVDGGDEVTTFQESWKMRDSRRA